MRNDTEPEMPVLFKQLLNIINNQDTAISDFKCKLELLLIRSTYAVGMKIVNKLLLNNT